MGRLQKQVTLWQRWKGYSGWKKLGIITLIGFGFCAGFFIGYGKGASEMSQVCYNFASQFLEKADLKIYVNGELWKKAVDWMIKYEAVN